MSIFSPDHTPWQQWWMLFIRGSVTLLFVLIVFVWPGLPFSQFISLVSGYILLDGIVTVLVSVQGRPLISLWWLLLLEGILCILLSMFMFARSSMTANILFDFIGIRAIITGLFEIAAAFSASATFGGGWLLALAAIVSLLLGFLCLFTQPAAAGLVSAIGIIGCYVLVCAVLWMVCALRVRPQDSTSPT
jgi:uncharacterized membrane protein HdeD (DUF308 family)